MNVIAVAIGIWTGPRSVITAFGSSETSFAFDVLTDETQPAMVN
jgi:hypothetical protein